MPWSRIDRFNNSQLADLILISTKAGGQGLYMQGPGVVRNLSKDGRFLAVFLLVEPAWVNGVNLVTMFDFSRSRAAEEQCIGRVYRLAQE